MTDKDHLEGVKNLIDKYENCYDKETALKYASDLMRYHARYFVKQTERVQELEKRLKIYQKRSWFEDYEKVAKQNKRYREALEKISAPIYKVTYADMVAVKRIARQALEGDLE